MQDLATKPTRLNIDTRLSDCNDPHGCLCVCFVITLFAITHYFIGSPGLWLTWAMRDAGVNVTPIGYSNIEPLNLVIDLLQ